MQSGDFQDFDSVGGSSLEWLRLPTQWPGQPDLLQWCQSMTPAVSTLLILAGIVYLLFGVHIFRYLITLNAIFLGAWLGAIAGARSDSAVPGAVIGGFVAGAVCWPTMKYSVAFMGGIIGALLGAAIWRSAGLDANFAWAGALSGLIFFGMLNFIIFRGSVMVYMSLQGAVMLIFGVMSLIYKYPEAARTMTESLSDRQFLLPLAIFIPTILGFIYQNTYYGQAADAAKKK